MASKRHYYGSITELVAIGTKSVVNQTIIKYSHPKKYMRIMSIMVAYPSI